MELCQNCCMVFFHFKAIAQKIVYEYLVDIAKETKLL